MNPPTHPINNLGSILIHEVAFTEKYAATAATATAATEADQFRVARIAMKRMRKAKASCFIRVGTPLKAGLVIVWSGGWDGEDQRVQ